MINHAMGNEDKENQRGKATETEIQTNIESKALEYINNNVTLIINMNSLHNYYQWVSLYPNLEKLCSTRFINETTKPKEVFEGKSITHMADQTELISQGNFIEGFVKEFITKNFIKNQGGEEEHKTIKPSGIDEKVVFDIKEEACLTVKSSHRLGTSVSTRLTNDKVQIFKDPECFNTYPKS